MLQKIIISIYIYYYIIFSDEIKTVLKSGDIGSTPTTVAFCIYYYYYSYFYRYIAKSIL